MNARTWAVAAVAAAALVATGCSSSSSSGSTSTATSAGGTVDIYSSLPMQGSSNAQTIPMVNGMKLALAEAHNKAGKFTVKYTELDDSTACGDMAAEAHGPARSGCGRTRPGFPGGRRLLLRTANFRVLPPRPR